MQQTTILNIGSLINGQEILGEGRNQDHVYNPYNGELIGIVDLATKEDLEKAMQTAQNVFLQKLKNIPAYQRSEILRKAADQLEQQLEEFAISLAKETGKPIKDSRGEVNRGIQVLRFAAEQAKKNDGEFIKMDAAIGGDNRIGFVKRIPIGVVAAITPFNYPLNLALHKIAPAIAAGCTVVVKPAGKTPLTTLMLAKLLEESGLPQGALNVVMGKGAEIGEALVTHPFVKKVSFTGSESVGLKLKKIAGNKKVTLELGSNAPNIIFNDANLELAVSAILRGGFTYAGQACISAQRIYVQRDIYQAFINRFVPLVEELNVGDPLVESTDLASLISLNDAKRVEEWVNEAVSEGAKVLTGGKREGTIYYPTVLEGVNRNMKVVCQEVFGPLVCVIPFDTEEDVINFSNDSDYGLQAGVFTSDINRAFRMADKLETGGVWINEVSTFRQDHYPYGGVKQSGVGKEGVKYAIEDMTEIKFIGINLN
jgi:acyl-CoA reductase-like NAD-dependent aldehyde dehydrogenase